MDLLSKEIQISGAALPPSVPREGGPVVRIQADLVIDGNRVGGTEPSEATHDYTVKFLHAFKVLLYKWPESVVLNIYQEADTLSLNLVSVVELQIPTTCSALCQPYPFGRKATSTTSNPMVDTDGWIDVSVRWERPVKQSGIPTPTNFVFMNNPLAEEDSRDSKGLVPPHEALCQDPAPTATEESAIADSTGKDREAGIELRPPQRAVARKADFLKKRWKVLQLKQDGWLGEQDLTELSLPSLSADKSDFNDAAVQERALEKLTNSEPHTQSPQLAQLETLLPSSYNITRGTHQRWLFTGSALTEEMEMRQEKIRRCTLQAASLHEESRLNAKKRRQRKDIVKENALEHSMLLDLLRNALQPARKLKPGNQQVPVLWVVLAGTGGLSNG